MNPLLPLQGNEMARTWPGSICHLQGVPVEDILLWPRLSANQVMETDIMLKPGKSWNIIKLLSQSGAFAEKNSYDLPGILWEQSISGILFGQSEFNHIQVENWTAYRWVLVAREVGSGISYLVGNSFRGASVSVSYDNRSTTITNLQFDFKAIRRAIIYKGILIPPNNPSVPSGSSGFAKTPIEFLVGDANTIPDQGLVYSSNIIIGKSIMIFIDGKVIPLTSFFNTQSAQFDFVTGTVYFKNKLNQGQLIQIFY